MNEQKSTAKFGDEYEDVYMNVDAKLDVRQMPKR